MGGEVWALGLMLWQVGVLTLPHLLALSLEAGPKYANVSFVVRMGMKLTVAKLRGSGVGDSSEKLSLSFWSLQLFFLCTDTDSPSLVDIPDNQKVEFLAWGGAHTALLTQVSVFSSHLCSSILCGELVFPRGGGHTVCVWDQPGDRGAFLSCCCCYLVMLQRHRWLWLVCDTFAAFDVKFISLRMGSYSLLVLENMGSLVTIQQRMN